MRRNHTKMMWAALAAAGLMLTGCSEDNTQSTEPAETMAATATPVTDVPEETSAVETEVPEEELLKAIGTPAEGEGVYAIKLTNATDMQITGVEVARSDTSDFSENLLEDDDVYAVDETRMFYYDTTEIDGDSTNAAEIPAYTVQLTFEGDMVAQLHAFPFEEMETGEIRFDADADVAYLEYTSVESGEEVNTKDAETLYIEQEQAEQAAAEQAAAQAEEEQRQQQAAAQQEAEAYEAQQQEAEAYEAQAAEESQVQEAEEPVYEDPAEESQDDAAVYEETPVEETPQEEAADPNEGCIGDEGLFY